MQKHEAKFTTKLQKWLKYNHAKLPNSYLGEVKVVRPSSNSTAFPFRELSEKEEFCLNLAKHKVLIQKHSDIAQLGTNCDLSVISGAAFIFLHWAERGNKEFFIIDVDKFLSEREESSRKSLTKERARAIAYYVGYII